MVTARSRWRVRKVRGLEVGHGVHPRGAPHLNAASALVRIGERFHAAADDEHHLVSFTANDSDPVVLTRLFTGTLPDRKKARKKAKPDLECLVALPQASGTGFVALLALGSGSRPTRERGAWLALDAAGDPVGRARRVDLRPLYAPLRSRFAEINIEGAFVVGDELRLLQRANGGDPRNACLAYAWRSVAAWLAGDGPVPRLRSCTDYRLGRIDGVPWGFTDGAALPGGGWAFSAVAEATDDAYADGSHRGSALGIVAANGKLQSFERLPTRWKIEGLASADGGAGRAFWLVTDADDPDRASCLLRASVSGRR